MPENNSNNEHTLVRKVADISIRLSLLFLLLYWCYSIMQPFIEIACWSIIFAVSLFPVYKWMNRKFGWKKIFEIHYLFRPYLFSALRSFTKNRHLSRRFEIMEMKDYSGIIHLRKKSSHTMISQALDKEFIQWRLSNPRIQYVVKYVNELNSVDPVGYFIYYLEGNKIILFDLFAIHLSVIPTMIHFLDSLSRDLNAKGIVTWSQLGTRFSDELRQNGFLVNPLSRGPLSERIPFIFYANEPELSDHQNPAHWEIVPFSHDSF